jgi:hypothetical protein
LSTASLDGIGRQRANEAGWFDQAEDEYNEDAVKTASSWYKLFSKNTVAANETALYDVPIGQDWPRSVANCRSQYLIWNCVCWEMIMGF